MVAVTLAIGVALLVVLVAVMASAITTVEEGDPRALLVSGEMRAVLEPGLHVVPPFVSTTHPIDPEAETVEKDGGSVPVPEEFSADLREATRQ